MQSNSNSNGRRDSCRPLSAQPVAEEKVADERKKGAFRIHPLFLLVGVWYAFTGKLFLFFISALVAVQHELAHAFAAAKLGYRLNAVVLMPFGAIIDGDLECLRLKDEISVAAWGPLCNLITAAFFVAIWWLAPTVYAFTDTVVQASLSVALVNFLPAYPLDGGRILKCALTRAYAKSNPDASTAERNAAKVCKIASMVCSTLALGAFLLTCLRGEANFSLLTFGIFLLVGAFGNKDNSAVYARLDFSVSDVLKNGAEIRRVAVPHTLPVKDALKFLSKDYYLVLEVYGEREEYLFDLPQNLFSDLFLRAPTPYTSLGFLCENLPKKSKNGQKYGVF